MKKKTFWAILGFLLAIPLSPSIFSKIGDILSRIGVSKVDDWVYEGGVSLSLNLAVFWMELGLGGKAIAILAAVLIVACIGFPLYRFAQGLLSKETEREFNGTQNRHDDSGWKKHRLWLGAPAVYLAVLLYITWILFAFDLQERFVALTENNKALVFWELELYFSC